MLHIFVSFLSCSETCTADPGSCPQSTIQDEPQAAGLVECRARTWLRLVEPEKKHWQKLYQTHPETSWKPLKKLVIKVLMGFRGTVIISYHSLMSKFYDLWDGSMLLLKWRNGNWNARGWPWLTSCWHHWLSVVYYLWKWSSKEAGIYKVVTLASVAHRWFCHIFAKIPDILSILMLISKRTTISWSQDMQRFHS